MEALPCVLIVDDVADARELLRVILETEGYHVCEAATGLEAIDAAERERPRLVLMDIHLPGLDGIEAARRIKAGTAPSHVDLIACTAHPSHLDDQTLFSAVFVKPFSPDALLATLRRLCGNGRHQ